MVDTVTVKFNLTKPEISGSPTTWGNKLNANMDIIDGAMDQNAQGIVPIGAMMMWAGATAPTNWLLCNGATYPTTGGIYDALFGVCQYTFGGAGASFAVPNLAQKWPMGAGPNPLGSTGGALSYQISVANLPSHNHGITDVAHNHGHSDPGHAHSVYDPTHIHGVGDPGHAHGSSAYQDAHSHGLDHQVATSNAGGQVAPQAGGWLITNVRTDAQQPAVHTTVNAAGTGVYLGYAATGIGIYASGTGMTNVASGTGLSQTNYTGSGTAMTTYPPFLALNFIIRYK